MVLIARGCLMRFSEGKILIQYSTGMIQFRKTGFDRAVISKKRVGTQFFVKKCAPTQFMKKVSLDFQAWPSSSSSI